MRTSAFLSLALAAIAFARPLADAEPCGDNSCTPGGGGVPGSVPGAVNGMAVGGGGGGVGGGAGGVGGGAGGVRGGGGGVGGGVASAHGDASAQSLGGGSANANANADASTSGGGCVQHCPPDPIGGVVQPGNLPASLPPGLDQIQGGGSGQIPGGDSSQIQGGGSGGVPGGISGGGLGTSFFYYSWTQTINTQVTIQFNQQLQGHGMQPSSTIADLLAALQLQEQVTIQQFLIALLGVESYLSQIISLIIGVLSNFGCDQQSSLAFFLNACGLTPQQPIYILFLKFGIWQPACQTC